MMCEQSRPDQLVRDVRQAEVSGFDFSVISHDHPAIVAQKAATVQILSNNRFRLGLGAGENLNEHVVGRGWPSVGRRHEMLGEAVDVIAALLAGEDPVNYRGNDFDVESARLWDPPEQATG